MQSELPWHVAGIPPEARDAARASARREGLSVGEWLTRRILRELSEAGAAEDAWWALDTKPRPAVLESRPFETPDMLTRLARSENETQDSHRRIEEQLKNLVRRLEQTERSQSDHSRALSHAATEINIATREHTQAVDQLGSRVANLGERIARIERQAAADSTKEAIKTLHQGLSRLADQLAETANRSAQQAAQLATTIESVAGKLLESREEQERQSQALQMRLAAAERALEEIETTQATHERENATLHRKTDELAQSLDSVKDRASETEAQHAGSIARLQDHVSKLDAQGGDGAIDRRLEGIENALSDMAALIEKSKRDDTGVPDSIESELRALASRLDASDKRNTDAIVELGTLVKQSAGSEALPAAEPALHRCKQTNIPPVETAADAFAADASEPAAATDAESLFAAARRAARDAERAEPATPEGFFARAATSAPEAARESRRTRGLLLGGLGVLIVAAVAAGLLLSQHFGASPAPTPAPTATHPQSSVRPHPVRRQPQPGPARPAAAPQPQSAPSAPASAPAASAAPPRNPPPVPHILESAAPQRMTPPARPAPPAPQSPQERLSTLAQSGNAKAQELLGLEYLDGDDRPVIEAEGAKWLERAALKGEALAAYRLGSLYERGQGVAADQTKADQWYAVAAKGGNRKAMHNLAVAYAQGTGVQKDLGLAVQWFTRAADLGLPDSEFNLAVMYERGMGVPQSLANAYKWYAIAAAQGDAESRARIEAIATQLSADDKATAEKQAAAFHAQPLDPAANIAPDVTAVVGG